MSYARRVDANQQILVNYLRAHGITVSLTYRLPGFVDAVCSFQPDCPRIALVEFKGRKGKLTKTQGALHRDTFCWLVRNDEDAKAVIYWLKTGDG